MAGSNPIWAHCFWRGRNGKHGQVGFRSEHGQVGFRSERVRSHGDPAPRVQPKPISTSGKQSKGQPLHLIMPNMYDP